MGRLKTALDAFYKASEEFDTAAALAATDKENRLTLGESRIMRDLALDAQIKGARGERRILEIKITHVARVSAGR